MQIHHRSIYTRSIGVVAGALLSMHCGGTASSSSGGGSGGWSVVASSGTVVSGTSFIGTDNSAALATGGVTNGVTAGDFDIHFVNSDLGWAVGNVGEVLKITDGGATATRLSFGTSSILRAVAPVNANQIWITGRDTVNEGASIYYSSDGGTNWTVQANTATTYTGRSITSTDRINGLAMTFANEGFAVGGLGDNTNVIFHTNNTGTTWTESYRTATSGTDDELQGVTFPDADHGFAVGNTGVILATTNDGGQWTQQTSGTTENLFDVRCSSILACVVVGNSGTVLRTTDGGTTWTAINAGTTENLSALDRVGDKIWAGGSNGTIIYSSDAGVTWTTQNSNTTHLIQAIHMETENVGWAAAAETTSNTGALLYTSSGGT